MVQIYPIPHFAGDVIPFGFIPHDRLAALLVIVFDRDRFADIVFGDAQFFLYAEFDWKAMRIPTAFALDAIPFEGIISAKKILDRSGHHVMDAGHTVGARRAFKKDPSFVLRTLFDTLVKNLVVIPPLQEFLVDGREMETFIFRIAFAHYA